MSDRKKPTCFVIMPITVPDGALEEYDGDSDHFVHVLDHLFAPAVEAAGYELIEPIMKGADLIQAEIIRNLEMADLVLCDMSRLNANVFFEFGIRSSLDRPSAVVKDDHTDHVPFDTAIINYHEYSSDLAPWKLKDGVPSLARHLKETAERADGRSSLWRYFGLTQRAAPAAVEEDPTQAKLDLLLEQLRQTENHSREQAGTSHQRERVRTADDDVDDTVNRIFDIIRVDGSKALSVAVENRTSRPHFTVRVSKGRGPSEEAKRAIHRVADGVNGFVTFD